MRVIRLAFEFRQRVPQGRRRRHGLLPALRPQRGRRARVHAAADVQGDRRAPLGPQALHRAAREPRRPHPRGGRARARRLPRPARGARSTRRTRRARRPSHGRRRRAARADGDRRTSTPASPRDALDAIVDALVTFPDGFERAPEARSASSAPAHGRSTPTRSTGRSPRRWRSARCCSRARRCASPARTRGAARSASATPSLVDHDTEAEYTPLDAPRRRRRRRS